MTLVDLLGALRARARAAGKRAVVAFGTTMNDGNGAVFCSAVREGPDFVVAKVLLADGAGVDDMLALARAHADEVLIDVEAKRPGGLGPWTPARADGGYRGNAVAADAFEQVLLAVLARGGVGAAGRAALVVGPGHLGAKIAAILVEHGLAVDVRGRDLEATRRVAAAITVLAARHTVGRARAVSVGDAPAAPYLVVVGATRGAPAVTVADLDALAPDGFAVDAGLGSMAAAAVAGSARPVFCLMADSGYAGLLAARPAAAATVATLGRRLLPAGFALVSGGAIGARGDVIVDDVRRPTRVLGIARGDGRVCVGAEAERYAERAALALGGSSTPACAANAASVRALPRP
jgi:hypothetical protein